MKDERPDVRPEDALQVAQRALAKVNELGREVEEISEELLEVSLRLSEIDQSRPYDGLTLDEKVGLVREHAYKRARDGHGKATLDYKDIMYGPFDGEPGSDHCYKLIRLAAGLEGDRATGSEIPGFMARDPAGDNYHLAVDAEKVKAGFAFSSENKTSLEGSRS